MAAVIEGARKSKSLKKLNISNNRICGVWSDAYGSQQFGSYDPTGCEVVADLLRATTSTLTDLNMSANNIGPTGGKALYEALRQSEASVLRHLDLRNSRFDNATVDFLKDCAASKSVPLEIEL